MRGRNARRGSPRLGGTCRCWRPLGDQEPKAHAEFANHCLTATRETRSFPDATSARIISPALDWKPHVAVAGPLSAPRPSPDLVTLQAAIFVAPPVDAASVTPLDRTAPATHQHCAFSPDGGFSTIATAVSYPGPLISPLPAQCLFCFWRTNSLGQTTMSFRNAISSQRPSFSLADVLCK